MQFEIRWLIRSDVPQVAWIDKFAATAKEPWQDVWTEEDFVNAMRDRETVAQVVCKENAVVGYIVYAFKKKSYIIERLVIDPAYRWQGAATMLVNKLMRKQSASTQKSISVIVHERNMVAQMFFKKLGFEAKVVLQQHFDEDDGYRFEYELKMATV